MAFLSALAACATAPVRNTERQEHPPQLENQPPEPDKAGREAAATDGRTSQKTLDAGHARASAGVRGLGSWLDRLFADENYEAEVNESRLRLRLDSFTEQYEGADAKIRARLYLKLPALGEKVRAEILSASEPQDVEGSGVAETGAGTGTGNAADDQRDIAAAISYFFRNDEKRSMSARIGAKFDKYTPDPFAGLRYRRNYELNEDWNFQFTERIRFYTLKGFESATSLTLDRGLSGDRLFRTGVNGIWLHEEEDFSYSHGFALFEPLNETTAVEYQLVNSFSTNPHNLDEVTLRFRYRRQIWREWLHFEVAPQVSFPDVRDYEPVPGIMFRLEAAFGD